MFTAVHYLCLSWAKSIQSKPHPIYWTFTLIIFSQLRLGLQSSSFPSGPSNKTNLNHSIRSEFKFLINVLKSVRRLDLIIKFSVWKFVSLSTPPSPDGWLHVEMLYNNDGMKQRNLGFNVKSVFAAERVVHTSHGSLPMEWFQVDGE